MPKKKINPSDKIRSMVMWDKILDEECINFMQNATEEREDGEIIQSFFALLKTKINDYKLLVVLAMQWATLEDVRQANLAIHYVGAFHASRFIILMDYLSSKFIKGELK